MNWKQKLTSRKFWVAVVGFFVPLVLSFGVSESELAEVVSIVISGLSAIAYILSEGMVDSYNIGTVIKENKESEE